MPVRFQRRKTPERHQGRRVVVGLSAGRRGKRLSASVSRREPGASVRLLTGLRHVFRPTR